MYVCSKCCDASSCNLLPGAVCDTGSCCKNCKFVKANTLCRKIENECDLPEYCTGSSPYVSLMALFLQF